ncbi:MAG: NAD(P)-dependent oxidoreductase [Spirulinaceae cyanobacterium]
MKIGVIGTGLMGQPLALRLLKRGHTVIAYNRTPEKLTAIAAAGGAIAPDAATVCQQSSVVILFLTDAIAIETLLFNPATLPHLAGTTLIQMGTIAPAQSQQLAEQVQTAGGDYLEAPVLGSIPQVKAGTLLVMVGSTLAQYQQQLPLFQALGENPQHIGPVGTAAALKLALNQLIGSLTTAFALSLDFVQQAGVPVDTFMQILRESALYAPTFDKKLTRMVQGNFANPNFPAKHLLKDMQLFDEAAKEQNPAQNTAIVQGVIAVVRDAIAAGHTDDDYSSLYTAISQVV